MKNASLALGMMLVVSLGGCGGPEPATPDTEQNAEALSEGSRVPPCGWTTVYYEWQCGQNGWDTEEVGRARFFCNGQFSPSPETTNCYEYWEQACNSMNSCSDYHYECPPRPTRICFPRPTFPDDWQFLHPSFSY